jgi:acetyl-CoA C-acetyltransferase
MEDVVIVAGVRTPVGKFQGALSGFSAVQLGSLVVREALSRARLNPEQVDECIMGNVISAGLGQNPARQAAIHGGLSPSVSAMTVNKVCGSGLKAVSLAAQAIQTGNAEIVIAGGMESMTNAPHLLPKSREGFKYGDTTLVDSMAYDGLWDSFTDDAMGALTDKQNAVLGISREEQDAFAARSHQRAAAAQKDGRFAEEIVPVRIPQRRGDPLLIDTDEGVRPETTAESLAKLRPAFAADGSVTAGSASQISDGACAVVVTSRTKAEELGLEWLAEIGAHGVVAGPDSTLQSQPANATLQALRREGLQVGDLDLAEINEAFAAVAVQSMRDLKIDEDKVNVDGGAIAMGHPLGMSGARLVLHLALELKRRGGGVGAASLCGGGGQGDALVLRVPKH